MRPSIASAVVLGGALLVGGVVVGRLAATRRADVVVICNAEAESGTPLRKSIASVSAWTRSHLATPEEQRFFSRLRDAPWAERAELLRGHARAQGVTSCPVADAYVELASEAIYRADVQSLCSYTTFPVFAELDPALRIAALEGWIHERAASPRTLALVAALEGASTPDEAAQALRQAAAEIDVITCDLAAILERPADGSCTPR